MGYSTDVTDAQWRIIEPFFIGENRGRHFHRHDKRKLVDAVSISEQNRLPMATFAK